MRSTPADLPSSHRDVLATIAALDGELPPKGNEIAANCAVTGDHIYSILEDLDTNEFINQQTDPDDQRITRNALTCKGYSVLKELQSQYKGLERPASVKCDDKHNDRGATQ